MSQWQKWVDTHNAPISKQRRAHSTLVRARSDLDLISEPIVHTVQWFSDTQIRQNPRPDYLTSGTLLEFLVSIGNMGLYRGHDEQSHANAHAMVELGDALLKRGARPSTRMVDLALRVGLFNLDGPPRLQAALRWDAGQTWDPQAALATCAENSLWNTAGGAACLSILEKAGAFRAPGINFESCPAARHPVVSAALSGDAKTCALLIQLGVSVNWQDPDTGATLWHLASSLSDAVGKALFPSLASTASRLAGSPTFKEVVFLSFQGHPSVKIRKGQTPLHCACDCVRPAALAALLACNPPVDALDIRGDAPLTILSRRWGAKAQTKAEPMAKALLAAGADPGRKDSKGLTPIQNMAAKGSLGALSALLELRPQDVGADDARARNAFASLIARGSEGLARAEGAAMTSATSVPLDTPTPRSKNKRI